MQAPTGAARWFKKLATDFAVNEKSSVQVVDVGDMYENGLYKWWIRKTVPTFPVLYDAEGALLSQIHSTSATPEVVVIDCHGDEKYRKTGSMSEKIYQEVKQVVNIVVKDPSCREEVE